MAIVIDTSALIEYFLSSRKGEIVKEAIEDSSDSVIIPPIVLSEFASKLLRKGLNPNSFIAALQEFTIFVNLDPDTAIKAGKLHAELRKIEKNIGMADCLIMQIAEENDAEIISLDSHFKHYKNSRIL